MCIKYKILYINKNLFIRILKLELVKYEEYVKNTQDWFFVNSNYYIFCMLIEKKVR